LVSQSVCDHHVAINAG